MPGPWEKYSENVKSAPWQKYQDQATSESKPEAILSPEGGEAALSGFGQAAAFGYLPSLRAMAQPVMDRGLNLVTGQNVDPAPLAQMLPGTPEYISARDKEQAALSAQQQQNPVSYGIGQVGGVLSTAAIPGKLAGAAKPAVGLLGKLGQAAATGAVAGAIQAPESKPGEFGPQLQERAEQAALGGVTGGLTQGAISAAGKAAQTVVNLPKASKEFAEKMAYRALGPSKGDVKRAIKLDATGDELKNVKSLGRFLIDKGLVNGGESLDDVMSNVASAKNQTGQQIGQLYQDVSDKVGDMKFLGSLSPKDRLALIKTNFFPKQLGQDALDEISAKWTGQPGGEQAIASVQKEVNNLMAKGQNKIGILDLKDFREKLDDTINFNQEKPTQEALKDFRRFLKSKIDARIETLDKVAGSDKTSALKQLNQDYGNLANAHTIVKNKVAAEQSNNFFSLTDKMFMWGGMGTGAMGPGDLETKAKNAAIGAAAGLISKGARRTFAPMAMASANQFGKLAEGFINNMKTMGVEATPDFVKKTAARYGQPFADYLFNNPALAGQVYTRMEQK